MREEIRRIQQQAKVTTIYVTHDQEEALSISDQIAVMHAGQVSQIGTPDETYENPNSIRVADFIGQANFLECLVKNQNGESLVLTFPSSEKIFLNRAIKTFSDFTHPKGVLFVRPERLEIIPETGKPNSLRGIVKRILYLGSLVRYFIGVFQQTVPRDVLVDKNRRIKGIREGDEIALIFYEDDVKLFVPDQKDQALED